MNAFIHFFFKNVGFWATAVVDRCLLVFIDCCALFDDVFGPLCGASCVLFVILFTGQTFFPLLVLGHIHKKRNSRRATQEVFFLHILSKNNNKKNNKNKLSNKQSVRHQPNAFWSVFIYCLLTGGFCGTFLKSKCEAASPATLYTL